MFVKHATINSEKAHENAQKIKAHNTEYGYVEPLYDHTLSIGRKR